MNSRLVRALVGVMALIAFYACSSRSRTPKATPAAAVTSTLPGGTPIALTLTSPSGGALVASPPGSVVAAGSISAGKGAARPDTALVYVLDASGATSTAAACGGASTVLGCELEALSALNAKAIALQTVGKVGAVFFSGGAAALDLAPAAGAQPVVAPGADADGSNGPDVLQALASVGSDGTATTFEPVGIGTGPAQVGTALGAAFGLAASSGLPANAIVLLSASTSAAGPGPGDLVVPPGVVVRAFALPGTTCAAGLGDFAALGAAGSSCEDVAELGDLASRLSTVLDALVSLELRVDGGQPVPLDATGLPTSTPFEAPFQALVTALPPGPHELCVSAAGFDAGGIATVEECASVKAATIALAPAAATYELGAPGQTATVAATVAAGSAGGVSGVDVEFLVTSGPNAGKGGAVETNGSGEAAFTYQARQHLEGLGTDVVVACFADTAGTKACATATVKWQDTTPPEVSCVPGPNPGGAIVARQGGVSPSGFMLLVATDAVDPAPVVFLVDTGSGVVHGPWPSGKAVKYTQAPGGPPSETEMADEGGGIEVLHVKGTGDPALRGKDASENACEPLVCPVPPGKK